MKLPGWIPQVPMPWNPAYREVWNVMSPDEKRWSFLFDAAILGVGLSLIFYLFT